MPCAVVYWAGYPDRQRILRGTVADMGEKLAEDKENFMGLLLIGRFLEGRPYEAAQRMLQSHEASGEDGTSSRETVTVDGFTVQGSRVDRVPAAQPPVHSSSGMVRQMKNGAPQLKRTIHPVHTRQRALSNSVTFEEGERS
jgi:hypothetical protein